jgi:phosphoglycerate dehydrogenase-like enzyme
MRLLIHERSLDRIRAAIEAAGGPLDYVTIDDAGEIRFAGAAISVDEARPDIAWANQDTFFSGAGRNFMTATLKSPDLKWVQSGAAGFDNPVFGKIVEKGARLTTSHGQAVGMADYVLWGVLDHLQRGPARRAAQAAGEWTRTPFREIAGSRWTIIGFGAIGRGVAVRARAFGAQVTGVRRSARPDEAAERMATLADLPDLLPDTDVLVLATPLTPETRHVAGAAAFARMRPGSVLVNVGRGGLVDEPALLAALDRGAPAHAVLDVFETEPLPADSPFWTHPGVTLTPHSSGMSAGNAPRNDAIFVDNLRRYLAGEPLQHEATAADVLAG